MSILSGTELIHISEIHQKAIPSFDVAGGNVDIIHTICSELAEFKACAFLASTPSSIKSYFGYSHIVKSVQYIADEYNVNVAIHLDHATSLKDVDAALESGFTSIMFDGSKLPFEKNVAYTQKTIQKANDFGASTEAELGIIYGKEDELISSSSIYPTIQQAIDFINATKVDFFAPAIGTSHGYYHRKPNIQWEFVKKLEKSCKIPLVLHGGTGLDNNVIIRLIELGFRKVNYATGIRSAFLKGLAKGLSKANELTKPQEYLKEGQESVRIYIQQVLNTLADKV